MNGKLLYEKKRRLIKLFIGLYLNIFVGTKANKYALTHSHIANWSLFFNVKVPFAFWA